ncbi:MAG: transcription termination/antitermination protein NusA [Clostridiales bacterium]|nr:transcription termination/antitermination protein NusA [Clostridiales bacterium]
MNSELITAIKMLEEEKGIDAEMLFESVELAMVSAYRKVRDYGDAATIIAHMDRETGDIRCYIVKTVVEDVYDNLLEISLEDARKINPNAQLDETVEVEDTPEDYGRIGAQTARQVITQRLREAEKGKTYSEYVDKEGELMTAVVQRVENGYVYVSLGSLEGVIPPKEQINGEQYIPGARIKVYVSEVKKVQYGTTVTVSRTQSHLIKRLFELEVPEIANGTVIIKSISRDPGSRTKIAVYSEDASVDPLGACVGPKGSRVANIVNEINGEKIDIIKWSEDPVTYIANALSPSKVLLVRIDSLEPKKKATAVVPDDQLSLAIGKRGQNAMLCAHLTGWNIDIKSESQATEILNGGDENIED